MKRISTWPANYRFGYVCAWAALVIGVALVAWTLITGGEAQDAVMGGIVGIGGAVLVVCMPGWALDGREEEERRRRAREARERR